MISPPLTKWQRRNWKDDFEHPDPVVVSVWKMKLRELNLTEGEIKAFVKGKLHCRGDTRELLGPYHQVERALYFYYSSRGYNGTSREMAKRTRDRIFDELGWSKVWGNVYISDTGRKPRQ